MSNALYGTDVLAWSRAQADRLRRMRDGERVNDLDWEAVIEEVEAVGKRELRSVASLLRQAMLHALKIIAWPDHAAARKWRNETAVFLRDAQAEFEPGMRQWLDVAAQFAATRRLLLDLDMRRPPAPLVSESDVSVDEVMEPSFGADDLIRRLRG